MGRIERPEIDSSQLGGRFVSPDEVVADLIAPAATVDMSQEEYDAAVQALIDFVEACVMEVEDFLAGQE